MGTLGWGAQLEGAEARKAVAKKGSRLEGPSAELTSVRCECDYGAVGGHDYCPKGATGVAIRGSPTHRDAWRIAHQGMTPRKR